LLAISSVEAVINAHMITVRAPIEGDISIVKGPLEGGLSFQAGDELLVIKNPRVDKTPLLNMQQSEEQLLTTVSALRAKKEVLERHAKELSAQKEQFRFGRIAQLEKRIGEIDADILSAQARREMAGKSVGRARALFAKGSIAEAFLENAERDDRVASETVKGLTDRRDGALVELKAVQGGTFVGDSYNDIPQSAQRSLAVELELAEVNVQLAGSIKQLANLRENLASEKQRYGQLSTAVIRAGVSGRIWETMTAPGEHVNAGQELMRLLDCKSTIVTASVSERDFEKLQMGQRARFRPTGGDTDYEGWIVNLTGLAAGASNNAIKQLLLSRAPYHVTLKFPELSSSSGCLISRAGRVIFDTGNSPLNSSETAELR